jgi:hypothetical protein
MDNIGMLCTRLCIVWEKSVDVHWGQGSTATFMFMGFHAREYAASTAKSPVPALFIKMLVLAVELFEETRVSDM